ncbi:hypothetical protein OJ997_07325 [Solirubrobacter phytolaccae]|uniref:Uncharacterized protein n=1 Tax=Solirubrobacter phytolaccae TaxID=1404360 RepID=A0A9X3NCZ5_9ACTN|nr:hypothetical protein [Solirubrobacter phytolaccae]MDA0180102.1 hypothetical protein [Solirubrobacter phytolaccae]
MRSKLLAGLTTAVATVAIAAPAAHAQEIIAPAPTPTNEISPANPATPNGEISPANPETPQASMGFGKCSVAKSSHGYVYAVCPVNANAIPYGETVSLSYKINGLHTFKPRTHATWSNASGTVTLTNDGSMPGQTPGSTTNLTQNIKIAFKNPSVAKVRKDLIIAMTGQSGNVPVTNPVAGA